MKIHLEIDPALASDMSAAYKVLNALKGASGAQEAPAGAPGPVPTSAPTVPPAGAPFVPPVGGVPASVPPSPAPAPAPAPAPTPPPSSGITQAQLADQINQFAAKYTPNGAKARFAEVSQAFNITAKKTSDIPPHLYEQVLPWFAVA